MSEPVDVDPEVIGLVWWPHGVDAPRVGADRPAYLRVDGTEECVACGAVTNVWATYASVRLGIRRHYCTRCDPQSGRRSYGEMITAVRKTSPIAIERCRGRDVNRVDDVRHRVPWTRRVLGGQRRSG